MASGDRGEVQDSSLPGAVLGFVSLSLQLGLVFGYQSLNLRLHALCTTATQSKNKNSYGRGRNSTFDFMLKREIFGVAKRGP